MSEHSQQIKSSLLKSIADMDKHRQRFCKNPNTDFTRNRKWSFTDVILFLLYSGCESVSRELLRYSKFGKGRNIPTSSSLIQRRNQIFPETFQFLFSEFTETSCKTKTYKGFRLLACDGSDINIPHNPKDKTTYFQNIPGTKGFNQIHLNAVYDLLGGFYQDAILQPARKKHEVQAMIDMMDRYIKEDDVLFIADRGYESYNLFAHAIENRQRFLIRVKDIGSSGIMSGLDNKGLLPASETFDKWITLKLTRQQTNDVKQNPQKFKVLPKDTQFDFLYDYQIGSYEMAFRVLRFPISENHYECIITNLPDSVSSKDIKHIYHMRWGIETSFRELKYVEGLVNIHSKKMDFIIQEIWCKLILHNFYAAVIAAVNIKAKVTGKYVYQINYTRAAIICKEFLFTKRRASPPDVELLLQKEMLPVRPGRHDERKLRQQSFRGFLYRAA